MKTPEKSKDNQKLKSTPKSKAQRLMKSDPNHDNWLGYIVAVFVNETTTQSIECCPMSRLYRPEKLTLTTHPSSGWSIRKIIYVYSFSYDTTFIKTSNISDRLCY